MELSNTLAPKGWTRVGIADVVKRSSGALATGPFGSSISSVHFQGAGVPVIRGGNLSADSAVRLNDEGLAFLAPEKAADFSKSTVYAGDLVFTCWGTIDQIGLITESARFDRYVISNKQMKASPDPRVVDSEFLYYAFSGEDLQSAIRNKSIGTSVPGFNLGQLKSLRFWLPPLPEQRAIAAALTEVDDLVAALDALIAKKRAVKTAAMQWLLTGRQRLPGFDGAWVNGSLDDVIERVAGGGTPSRSNSAYWGGPIPWATVKDISSFDPTGTQETITEEGLKNSATRLVPAGTLILATRMLLGKAVVYETDVSINQDLKALFFSPGTSIEFVNHWIDWKADHIESLGSGSTVRGLALKDLRALAFKRPAQDEQEAIATVLSDMDSEIAALEARRDKTAMVKTGMMQELLTGRTRLV